MTNSNTPITLTLTPDELELLHFLIGAERGRIWRDSPAALDHPEPGSWAQRVDTLYSRATWIRDSNFTPHPTVNDPTFNLAMAAQVGDSWYTHLPAIEAAMAEEDRIASARWRAGWTCDEGGWYSPEGISASDWEHVEGYPLPEDPEFADFADTFYFYEALDVADPVA